MSQSSRSLVLLLLAVMSGPAVADDLRPFTASNAPQPTLADAEQSAEAMPVHLRITEFFFRPPRSDQQDAYLEITGPTRHTLTPAKTSREFDYFLLMLENEPGEAGKVDKIIPLAGASFNSEGMAWFYGAAGEHYPADGGRAYEGEFEPSGGTLMLIAVPYGRPGPGADDAYDATVDGVATLGGDWDASWLVLDSVGVCSRGSDAAAGAVLYGRANFAPGNFSSIATPMNSKNVNTTRYDKGDVGMVDPINYLGRPGRRWFAARLTDGGDEWSEQERNYAIAADDTHQGEPCCMDQRGRAPYKVGDVVTDNQGDEPACNCGE